MDTATFIKALLPVWTIELIIVGLYHTFGSEEVTVLSAMLFLISIVLLPLVAGFRVTRVRGGAGLAVIGAISISVISVAVVGISYWATSAGIMAFQGFVIASLMFSVPPQAVIGYVGAIIARKFYAKAT